MIPPKSPKVRIAGRFWLSGWLLPKSILCPESCQLGMGSFFGQGIIEPVDDVRVSNPPSNPELLDQLSKKFTDYNYDFKNWFEMCAIPEFTNFPLRPIRRMNRYPQFCRSQLQDYGPKSCSMSSLKQRKPRTNSRAFHWELKRSKLRTAE